jgi:hypothetical protein
VPNTLPKDVTLRDLLQKFENPDDFVRRAFGVLHDASKEHGDVVMRLGLTGTGKRPNYRLEEAATGRPIVAIDGNNHQPWPGDEDFTSAANWSERVMSKNEVAELLAEIRNFRR